MDEEHTFDTKWTQLQTNWCKKYDTKAFMGDFPAIFALGNIWYSFLQTLLSINTMAMQKHLYYE